MRLFGQVTLPHRPEDVPISRYLLAAGADRCAVLDEGAYNRAGILEGRGFSDYNRSNPPDPTAAPLLARPIRYPAKAGMGAGPVHALIILETVPTLGDLVDAARDLRANLAASAEVSIATFPSRFGPWDPAWAAAAEVVTSLVWGAYVWDAYLRPGGSLDDWFTDVAMAERKLREWFPRRRRKTMVVTPCYQIHFDDDLRHLHDTPLPLDFWRRMLVALKAAGWDVFIWGMYDAGRVRGHMEVAAEVYGLRREMPGVEVG